MQRGIVAPMGLALVALASGCLADSSGDGGILVLRNVVADGMCQTMGSTTEPTRDHGTLDLLLGSGYVFIAQMKSRITAIDGQEDQRTIVTTGAKVDIVFPGSTLFNDTELAELQSSGLTRFKQPFSQVIFPNGGVSDGFFDLIPGALVQRIAQKAGPTRSFHIEAVATFTIEGEMSGAPVTSQSFSYAVTIGNEVTVNVLGECPLPKGTTMLNGGYACNPAQDGTIDCCASRNGADIKPDTLACPALVSTI